MAQPKLATTTVSTKGQVILPKAIRVAKDWGAGCRLTVEETDEGVLLRAERPFARTKLADVFGCLNPYVKAPLSNADISRALRAAAKARRAGD